MEKERERGGEGVVKISAPSTLVITVTSYRRKMWLFY